MEHRGALVIRSSAGPLSAEVANTDPAYRKEGPLGVALETFENRVAVAEPLDDTEEARRSADLVNRSPRSRRGSSRRSEVNARRRAEGRPGREPHPLPRRRRPRPAPACRSRSASAPRGGASSRCRWSGGSRWCWACRLWTPRPTCPRREQYAAWAALAAEALGGYDALYIHIKGPDIPAHDGRALDKKDVCEDIDAAFFGELLPLIDLDRVVLAVTADHSTSCVRKAHTADPVPAPRRRRRRALGLDAVLRRTGGRGRPFGIIARAWTCSRTSFPCFGSDPRRIDSGLFFRTP